VPVAELKGKGTPRVNTCGLYDWIEDLKYIMESKGLQAEVEGLKEPEGPAGSFRVAAFRVRLPA
jgi:hypothetical protein